MTTTIQRALPVTHELALLDIAHVRALEQRASAALPPNTLMARAGTATARLALALAPHAERIWIAAGPGNNGGDGIEAACHLQRAGKRVKVGLIGDVDALPPDAAQALARARAEHVPIESALPSAVPDLAIDALLGIGANRAPQGAIEAAIRHVNAWHAPVLAIDVPSGLNADTGEPLGDACIRASHTLTMLAWKPGLFTAAGRDHAGSAWLAPLQTEIALDPPQAWLSGVTGGVGHAPRRHAQHKGSFGDVAIVGGAPGMGGAALLAARAAQAAGAGRVYVDLLNRQALALDPMHPELMLRAGWSSSAPDVLARSTVVCGCGGGDAVRASLPRLLSTAHRLVLDADALNAVATDPGLQTLLQGRAARGLATVLTPHPLEAARLLGCTTAEVQRDRLRAAQELASRWRTCVVLKGSGSVIALPGRTPRINATGSAALATAGTGDVLAGWLGGRWAQIGNSDDAAAAAFAIAIRTVAEHGAAVEPPVSGALLASALIERLGRR